MATVDYIGEFHSYDIENNILSLQIEAITPEEQSKLEKAVLESQRHRFKHSVANSSSISRQQRECWYGSLRTIILESESLPTAKRMKRFNTQMRKKHFPAEDIEFDDFDRGNEDCIPDPKHMKDMTHEEMGEALQSLHDVYDFIDWSKYMEIK